MRRSLHLAAIGLALFALTACNKGEDTAKTETVSKSATGPASTPAKAKAGEATPKAAKITPKATKTADTSALLNPAAATEKAPETFAVKFETTKGDIIIDVTRAWSPTGADRFYNLVKLGYYNDVAFFRVIGGFMAQIGLHGTPDVNKAWRPARIKDDPVTQSNTRGMVTFAKTGAPNSRTTQIFFNFKNNSNLDSMGFAPFGKVRDMKVVDSLHSGYGEGAPRGKGPSQGRIQDEGNTYLKADFPQLDYVKSCSILTK